MTLHVEKKPMVDDRLSFHAACFLMGLREEFPSFWMRALVAGGAGGAALCGGPFKWMLSSRTLRAILLLVSVSAHAWVPEVAAGQSQTEWPKQIGPLVTNSLPAELSGVPHGFLGAAFHIEHFDSRTTLLRGTITLTNLTDRTNTIALCLKGPSISYQMELRDSGGNVLPDPNGIRYNWNAQRLTFGPFEVKGQAFELRLKDYFDLKPGKFQLLFVFNELLVRHLPKDEWWMRPWSGERLVLECE